MAKKLNDKIFNKWTYKIIDDYSHRYEVYYGGAGSGKSYGAFQKILLKSMNRKRKVLVIRKIQATIKDSVFSQIIELLYSAGIYSLCRINKTDHEITLPNGSVFIFKGFDDREKIKSITGVTDIVAEEATELSRDDFEQLNLRLRGKDLVDGQIYVMFNPVSKVNWVYDHFIINPPKSSLIIQTTYLDNEFIDDFYKQELEELKNRNPNYYKIYVLGEFATLDKLIFPYIEKRLISKDEVMNSIFWCGLDFGYINDPSALCYGYVNKETKTIYITGEYIKKGMLNNEIADVIYKLGLQKEKIYADSAERKSIDEIKAKGIYRIQPVKKGKDSVIHGLQAMQQYKIVVDERCPHTISEFENYTWKKDKKTDEYINEPIDAFNHSIDAIRYGLRDIIDITLQPRVVDKRRIGV